MKTGRGPVSNWKRRINLPLGEKTKSGEVRVCWEVPSHAVEAYEEYYKGHYGKEMPNERFNGMNGANGEFIYPSGRSGPKSPERG